MSMPPPPPPPPFRPAPPPPLPPSPGGGASSFDFGQGLRFFFDDPDWQRKIAFGSLFVLLSFLLVGIPFLMGYCVRVIQRTARGEAPLPDWDDLGGLFSDGLSATGVVLVYSLAVIVPVGCGMGLVIGGMSAAAGGSGGASDAAGAAAAMAMMAMYGLMFLIGLALFLFVPAALTRYALAGGDFGTAFQFGENVAFIKRNLVPYLLALLLYWVCSFVAQFGIILCCVGILPLTFWAYCVLGWGMGEVARMDPASGAAGAYR